MAEQQCTVGQNHDLAGQNKGDIFCGYAKIITRNTTFLSLKCVAPSVPTEIFTEM